MLALSNPFHPMGPSRAHAREYTSQLVLYLDSRHRTEEGEHYKDSCACTGIAQLLACTSALLRGADASGGRGAGRGAGRGGRGAAPHAVPVAGAAAPPAGRAQQVPSLFANLMPPGQQPPPAGQQPPPIGQQPPPPPPRKVGAQQWVPIPPPRLVAPPSFPLLLCPRACACLQRKQFSKGFLQQVPGLGLLCDRKAKFY